LRLEAKNNIGMKNFKKLSVWQKSMLLTKEVYQIAKQLPNEERFGLYSQMTRSAVSIPGNIAEGCSRSTDKDFRRFLGMALGSAFELETQLILVQNISLVEEDINKLILLVCEVQKMLQGLMKKLNC
jgi:four helix bundle protein